MKIYIKHLYLYGKYDVFSAYRILCYNEEGQDRNTFHCLKTIADEEGREGARHRATHESNPIIPKDNGMNRLCSKLGSLSLRLSRSLARSSAILSCIDEGQRRELLLAEIGPCFLHIISFHCLTVQNVNKGFGLPSKLAINV